MFGDCFNGFLNELGRKYAQYDFMTHCNMENMTL